MIEDDTVLVTFVVENLVGVNYKTPAILLVESPVQGLLAHVLTIWHLLVLLMKDIFIYDRF